MKGRVIVLCDLPGGEPAAALMIDGRLEDLILGSKDGTPMIGDILAAKVTRILPGKGGAFCETGGGSAFIRTSAGLSAGARLLVQVTSLPEPGKAVTVSPRILVKGPRLILTPGAEGVNVSRQIRDEDERARLTDGARAALEATGLEDCGLIVRTGAEGEEGQHLQAELAILADRWQRGAQEAQPASGPAGYALREWVAPMPDQIMATADVAKALMRDEDALWSDARLAERLLAEDDPAEASGLSEALEVIARPDIALPAGSIAVEPTRALVSVDVNTGGDFSGAAGQKANLAAARDLPRLLRLKGLGGQIVIDFAPMPKKERKGLEAALKAAFRKDPVETSLVGWTQMGLYEMQRKRERRPLREVMR